MVNKSTQVLAPRVGNVTNSLQQRFCLLLVNAEAIKISELCISVSHKVGVCLLGDYEGCKMRACKGVRVSCVLKDNGNHRNPI